MAADLRAIDLPVTHALLVAIPWASAIVQQPTVASGWSTASALAGYSVGGLAGHLVRAVERADSSLRRPAPDGAPALLTDWYLANRFSSADDLDGDLPTLIREDGERLGAEGPAAVAAELDRLRTSLADRLAQEDADRMVAVLLTDRPVSLVDYLASRLLEVVVHGDDLAASILEPAPTAPEAAMNEALAFLLRLARTRSGDLDVLRAFTRAERVSDPYGALRVL